MCNDPAKQVVDFNKLYHRHDLNDEAYCVFYIDHIGEYRLEALFRFELDAKDYISKKQSPQKYTYLKWLIK